MGFGTLGAVPDSHRFLSVGDLSDHWGLTKQGVHARIKRFGLNTENRRVKGGFVFTREEIEEVDKRIAAEQRHGTADRRRGDLDLGEGSGDHGSA